MRTKYKQWAVDYLKESKNIFTLEDKEKIVSFINEKPTYIEIGPGKGQFIIEMARKHPEFNFLIVEINHTVAGIALKKIDDLEITNVKMIADDFFKIKEIIEKESIEGIFLNFSDPWGKKRHEKRRLTYDDFIKVYLYILKMSHNIYYKSDNYDFYLYSKSKFIEFGFELLIDDNNYFVKENDFDAETEFERRYIDSGIKINRIIAKKVRNLNENSEE